MPLALDQIYHGDASLLLYEIPVESIDCVVTSPPYDALRTYEGTIEGDVAEQEQTFPFEQIAKALAMALKPGGVIIWVVGAQVKDGSESLAPFKQAMFFVEECGLRLHDTMIYEKNGVSYPAKLKGNRYTQCFEYMFVFSKGKPKTAHLVADKKNRWVGWTSFSPPTERKYDGKLVEYRRKTTVAEFSPRYNIWRYATGGGFSYTFKLAKGHPACFPESLVIDHLRTWTVEGDTVLDPMNGVGTTTAVAKWMNRHFIGIDKVEKYCDLARQRLEVPIDIDARCDQSKKYNNSRYPQDEQRKKPKESSNGL